MENLVFISITVYFQVLRSRKELLPGPAQTGILIMVQILRRQLLHSKYSRLPHHTVLVKLSHVSTDFNPLYAKYRTSAFRRLSLSLVTRVQWWVRGFPGEDNPGDEQKYAMNPNQTQHFLGGPSEIIQMLCLMHKLMRNRSVSESTGWGALCCRKLNE